MNSHKIQITRFSPVENRQNSSSTHRRAYTKSHMIGKNYRDHLLLERTKLKEKRKKKNEQQNQNNSNHLI